MLEVRWTPADCALRAATLGPALRREGASLIRYRDVCCRVANVDDDRVVVLSECDRTTFCPFRSDIRSDDRRGELAPRERPATAVRDPAVSFRQSIELPP